MPDEWYFYKRRGLAHFYLKHYEQALADIAKAVELNPEDSSNLTWIPLEDVASCPDEQFRTGMVALADKTIQILESNPATTSEDAKTEAYLTRADVYLAAGKLDQADRLIRDLLPLRRRTNGPKSAETVNDLAILSSILVKQKKYAEAETLLRECMAIRKVRLPAEDWLHFGDRLALGEMLLGQQKFAEAEPLLRQGYEGMKQREAKVDPFNKRRLTETVERIVQLYEATKQPEKARTWREKLPSGKHPGK
jgi:tetratricopeptide (TPR) repeat protein